MHSPNLGKDWGLSGDAQICYAGWENGWNMSQVLIFSGIESCHDIGMLRPILWSFGAASAPTVVESGGVVADGHDFGGLRSGPWAGSGIEMKAVHALTRVPWEYYLGLRRPHALRGWF